MTHDWQMEREISAGNTGTVLASNISEGHVVGEGANLVLLELSQVFHATQTQKVEFAD